MRISDWSSDVCSSDLLDTSRWRAALGVNGWEDSVRAGLLGPVRAEWPRSGCIEAGPALTGRFAGFTPPRAFSTMRARPPPSPREIGRASSRERGRQFG